MALRRQIVDLVGPGLLDQADQVGGIREVAVVQEEPGRVLVRVAVQMIDPAGVERRGAPLDPVHHVALLEQQRRQIGAVLPGHPGDQRDLGRHSRLAPGAARPSARLRTVRRRHRPCRGPERNRTPRNLAQPARPGNLRHHPPSPPSARCCPAHLRR